MSRIAGIGIAILALLLIALFAVPWPKDDDQQATSDEGPEALAEIAFRALQTGVFDDLGARVATGQDLEWAFAEYARGNAAGPAADPLAAVGGARAFAERLRRDAAATFTTAREEADFVWDGAEVVDARTVERTAMPGGVPLVDIVFEVGREASSRHFAVPDCFATPRGWVTNAGVVYLGGGDTPTSSWVEQRVARDQRRLAAALTAYAKRRGAYPETLPQLLRPGGEGVAPLLYGLPQDPWGQDYYYEAHDHGFQVWSVGPDGLPSTDDDVGGDP